MHAPREAELDELAVSFPRGAGQSIGVAMSYRLFRVARILFGSRRVLLVLLRADRWLRRFAHESSVEVLGEPWLQRSLGLRASDLASWLSPQGAVIDIGC